MKRRKFLKTAGATSVVLSAGSLMAFNRFLATEDRKFTPEELKTALDTYFTDVMAGKYFNPNILPPNGKIMIVRSYSIEINEQKNTIFDIADLVIERLKKSGFDAGSLKDCKVPDGLVVGNGIVHLPNQMFPIRIDALKNYDATLSLQILGNISTEVVPANWKNISHFEEKKYQNNLQSFDGNIDTKYFHLIFLPDPAKKIDFRFNVDKINPDVNIIDFIPEITSFNCLIKYFSNEQLEQFKI